MLVKLGLNAQVIVYVKGEMNNLSTMTTILTSIISCEDGNTICGVMLSNTICGGVMSNCCQHDTHDFKVCVGLTSISIKETQFIL
jgi:hypothetical protein